MSVCCECCVLSGRGLCDEPITRPEDSCRLCRVVLCDLETSWMRRPWPTGGGGLSPQKQTNKRDNFSKRIRWCNKHLPATDRRLIYPQTFTCNRQTSDLPTNIYLQQTDVWFTHKHLPATDSRLIYPQTFTCNRQPSDLPTNIYLQQTDVWFTHKQTPLPEICLFELDLRISKENSSERLEWKSSLS